MTENKIMEIFKNTDYVRTGGSDKELDCANYLKSLCEPLGNTVIEEFTVDMADVNLATLTVDGKQFTCKGYKGCGSGEITAPIYYLRANDKKSLENCRGKIVMLDGYLGYWRYKDLIENGALGFITYSGSVNYADRDIDARELRSYVSEGVKILGVNLNVKDAVEIIKSGAYEATVKIEQNEYEGKSRNVILELPGQCDKWIVFTAHYDSTSLSRGAYDNMSGCVGLLYAAQYFSENPHRYGLRFIFCGSEERGLLGSKAYCKDHESELENIDLNINLDMIGCTMGKFIACCTCENDAVSYIKYFGLEKAFQVAPYQDVYSSDSTPFADKGVPAISFARIAPKDTATIHDSYDTVEIIRASQMKEDCEFITAFAERMANAVYCPVSKTIPDNIKTKLDEYLCRKRKG